MPGSQSGLVLVVALIILVVLTLIGISSMSSSTLEMKVAGNMQQHTVAFQAAQSRLAFAMADDPVNPIDYLIAAVNGAIPDQTCNPSDGCPNDAAWVATATVKYIDCSKGIGSSLESGKGFSYRWFEVTATGETATLSSRSVQRAATKFPVKGCEGDDL
ncbi:MAG: pilus assembly PilX N-terminal domain-containing protein [Gammaproteobacteria bacterium]|nr:pilus assembly PilX N-terminal domain-containing protein [Gammaproteobacteria bacterium]